MIFFNGNSRLCQQQKLLLGRRQRQNRRLATYVSDLEFMDQRRCYRALVRMREVVMRALDQQWMDNRALSHVCQSRKQKSIEAWKWVLLARWRRMKFLIKVGRNDLSHCPWSTNTIITLVIPLTHILMYHTCSAFSCPIADAGTT